MHTSANAKLLHREDNREPFVVVGLNIVATYVGSEVDRVDEVSLYLPPDPAVIGRLRHTLSVLCDDLLTLETDLERARTAPDSDSVEAARLYGPTTETGH